MSYYMWNNNLEVPIIHDKSKNKFLIGSDARMNLVENLDVAWWAGSDGGRVYYPVMDSVINGPSVVGIWGGEDDNRHNMLISMATAIASGKAWDEANLKPTTTNHRVLFLTQHGYAMGRKHQRFSEKYNVQPHFNFTILEPTEDWEDPYEVIKELLWRTGAKVLFLNDVEMMFDHMGSSIYNQILSRLWDDDNVTVVYGASNRYWDIYNAIEKEGGYSKQSERDMYMVDTLWANTRNKLELSYKRKGSRWMYVSQETEEGWSGRDISFRVDTSA